ncbi:putative phospholipid metabolism enzyme regulator [Erysiphe neolycopersici]|uniref:Putative phospholipid metabolism enzyme regulator n=1 Tax=Erysiphe neolycopersici TaxID=212602 RepID=A0A420HLN8_9PEZI|nr:putative phospholipid metabolism enzyme regulator [Erysiphe neolycopersici]
MDKSSKSIPDPTLETAASVDSTHGKGSLSPSMVATGRHIPKEDLSATSSASRESSPTRRFKKHLKKTDSPRSPGLGPVASLSQSKKKSSQEIRSTRSTIPPSVSATQRALSVSSIQSLTPDSNLKLSSSVAEVQRAPSLASDTALKTSLLQKSLAKLETNVNNRWPISQRLRTPPPSTHPNLQSTRNNDSESSSQLLKMVNSADEQEQMLIDSDPEDSSSFLGMRTPARGVSGASSTLETVQESSQPNTPISTRERDLEKNEISTVTSGIDEEIQDDFGSPKTIKQISIFTNESGNESAGKGDSKLGIAPSNLYNVIRSSGTPSKSFKSISICKAKPSTEGFSQNMTVETETVSSVSQISVGPAGLGIIGSLRVKPSNETIRPKKEKKKVVRKPPSLTSGAASSKADIFEAKVASAVDEATSSDSEETFVYESNPPESNERPRRFQSRTPSTTSMMSQIEQRNGIRNILDGHQIIVMKKSMKFTNSHNNSSTDHGNGDETGKGTVRSSVGIGKETAKYHHVNGRWRRHAGNSHPSLFDDESTFSNVASSRLLDSSSRRPSRLTSPKTSYKTVVDNGKDSSTCNSGYNAAHHPSERTPLLRSARSVKLMHHRRQNGSIIQLEQQSSRPFLSRCKGCLALCLMLVVVISGAAGFIYAKTHPLVDTVNRDHGWKPIEWSTTSLDGK